MSMRAFCLIEAGIIGGMVTCLFVSFHTPDTRWLYFATLAGVTLFWLVLGFKAGWDAREEVQP